MLDLVFDCGGTSTRTLAQLDGVVIFEGKGGPANWASTPREILTKSLESSLEGFDQTPDRVLVSMAGILDGPSAQAAESQVRNLLGTTRVKAVPDFHSNWRACDNPAAICVICGTGSLVCSQKTNQMVKSSGGGSLIGDPGSGFSVGRRALLGLHLGQITVEECLEPLSETFGATQITQVDYMIYGSESPVREIARFGRAIAQSDDPKLCILVEEEMELLATLVNHHLTSHSLVASDHQLYLSGGFWQASPRLANAFEHSVGMPCAPSPLSPIQGAMKLVGELL